jgi:hypothetical protein
MVIWMKKRNFCWLLVPALLSFILVFSLGCSKSNEQPTEEKGKIEKMTDQAAEKIEKKIQTPLDKARATQDLGDERLNEMDKALQKQ